MQTMKTAEALLLTQVPASLILSQHSFRPLLPDGWQAFPLSKRMAWLSLWSQWFFAGSLVSWADNLCSRQQAVPLWEFQGQLQINDRGCPEHWINAGAPLCRLTPDDQQQLLERLVTRFIAPVCQTLASLAGDNLTVFWSNAAVRLVQGMQRAADKNADVRPLQRLLETPRLADGDINRLKSPLRSVSSDDGEEHAVRRHCCLIFRLDGYQKCASCPLDKCSKKN